MRKIVNSDEAKSFVTGLLGQSVVVKHNRGRNRIKTYNGVVSEAHANVFLVTIGNAPIDRLSCSYSDVVCGEIVLKPVTLNKQ